MAERLSKFVLYSYGIADLFFALMVNMEAYFFTAFLTDYAQFSLTLVGQILGLTSLIDIACALAGGVLLQKVTLKYGGKYRSWFLVGPPLIAPLFILQFTKIGSNTLAALLVMIGFVAGHLLLNVVVSASGAMVGRLSQLPNERTILSASRAQGMAAAGLIFSITSMPMILFFGAHTDKIAGFTLAVSVYAFLMICGYLLIYWMTAGRDPYDEVAMDAVTKKSGPSIKEIVGLVINKSPAPVFDTRSSLQQHRIFSYHRISHLPLYVCAGETGVPVRIHSGNQHCAISRHIFGAMDWSKARQAQFILDLSSADGFRIRLSQIIASSALGVHARVLRLYHVCVRCVGTEHGAIFRHCRLRRVENGKKYQGFYNGSDESPD